MSMAPDDIVVKRCPYPDCGSPVENRQTNCTKCRNPLVGCTECDTTNRAFARHCRFCNSALPSSLDASLGRSLNSQSEGRPVQPVRVGEIRDLQPDLIAFGGYLWGINADGDLYRLSPNAKLEKYGTLPGNGFTFPISVEENEKEGPVIYTNNRTTAFKFTILDRKHDEILKLQDDESFRSEVLREGENSYFLCERGSLELRCIGGIDSKYALNDSRPITNARAIYRIGESLWLLTTEKIICFDGYSLSHHKDLFWTPLLVFPSKDGVWYARKLEPGSFSQKQTVATIVPDGSRLSELMLQEDIPLTAKLAVDPDTGRLVVFSSEAVTVFESSQRRARKLKGIIDITNPEAALLTANLLFWFESEDYTLYLWYLGTQQVRKLFASSDPFTLSRLYYVNGALYGLSGEEIWRWDLSGA